MKRILLALAICISARAQYAVINNSDAPANSLIPLNAKMAFSVQGSAPASCTMGKEVWVDSGTQKWYLCTATNTWTEIPTLGQAYVNPSFITSIPVGKVSGLNTSAVPEVTNLYFTNARATAAMAGLFEVPLTFSAPLVRTTNAISISLWGSGTRAVAANALGVSGNCVNWTAAGLGDTGSACGSGGGGANTLGFYLVTQTANSPANAVNLGALSTGILKLTVSGGVATPSVAVPGADYQAPLSNGFFQIAGPATSIKTHTWPNQSIDFTALTGVAKWTGGVPGVIAGTASDCLHVDGGSAACASGSGNMTVTIVSVDPTTAAGTPGQSFQLNTTASPPNLWVSGPTSGSWQQIITSSGVGQTYWNFTEGAASGVPSPASGDQRVFLDSADHHWKRKNSSGTVTDLEAFVSTTILPNTAPAAGQVPCGNAGATAYAPCTVSGDLILASTGAGTLATVNTNTGVCGDSTHVCQVTLDGKGRATAAAAVAISGGPGGSGGIIVNHTANYTTVAGDCGTLQTFDNTTLTGTLPTSAPAMPCIIDFKNKNVSQMTVAHGSVLINGASADMTGILQFQDVACVSDGVSGFQCGLRDVAGTGITITTGATAGQTISLTNTATTVNGQSCALGSTCTVADATKVPTTTTVNGHALSSNVTVTAADVSLGSVTNDAQTKAAVMPNTPPAAGQLPFGNAGGTAYAPATVSGDFTCLSTGACALSTVNTNTGACGDSTHVCQVTLNGKGLATAATAVAVSGGGQAATNVTTTFNASTMTFTCNSNTVTNFILSTAVTANVTASSVASCNTGQLFTISPCQDGTGGRTFSLPTGFPSGLLVSPIALACTHLTFKYDGTSYVLLAQQVDTAGPNMIGTEQSLSGTPGGTAFYAGGDSVQHAWCYLNPSGTKSCTVTPDTGATHSFLTAISAAGAISKAQPAFSDLSGSATAGQLPGTLTSATAITNAALTTPAITGLATGSGVSAAATASTLATRDSSANLTANNTIDSYTTTATATGITTLTVTSTKLQYFTGTQTQVTVLPVTSTLALGQEYEVVNNSTGAVTVSSSGINTILVVAPSARAAFSVILTTGTTAASWSYKYWGEVITSGKSLSVSNSLTLAGTDGTTMTFPSTSATMARTDAANTFTGIQTMTSPALTTPVITTDIHSTTAGSATVGTAALPFGSVFIGGAATNNMKVTGASAAARVYTVPDTAADTNFVMANTSTNTALVLHASGTAGLGLYSAIAASDLPVTPLGTGTTCTITLPHGYCRGTGNLTVTVPAPTAAGDDFCVWTGVGVTATVSLSAITGVQYGKTDMSAYGTANTASTVTSAQGNRICFVASDTTHWDPLSFSGTWSMP